MSGSRARSRLVGLCDLGSLLADWQMTHGMAINPPSPREGGKKVMMVMAIGSVFCDPMITTDLRKSSGQRSM